MFWHIDSVLGLGSLRQGGVIRKRSPSWFNSWSTQVQAFGRRNDVTAFSNNLFPLPLTLPPFLSLATPFLTPFLLPIFFYWSASQGSANHPRALGRRRRARFTAGNIRIRKTTHTCDVPLSCFLFCGRVWGSGDWTEGTFAMCLTCAMLHDKTFSRTQIALPSSVLSPNAWPTLTLRGGKLCSAHCSSSQAAKDSFV